VDGLCKYHYQALKRVHEAYSEWKTRKRVSFDEYVLTLLRLKSTGDYVKEVITHVIRKA
jgi:DNA topoisomerase-1